MAEERCVTEYTDEEVSEDPFILLSCGHIYLMSSLVSTVFDFAKTNGVFMPPICHGINIP
jgi:hypothetical protein